MNKKLITVFLILTAIPVGLLGWLAVVGYRSEVDRNQRQIEALGRQRLTTINLQVGQYFDNLESELLGLPNLYELFLQGDAPAKSGDESSAGADALRELVRESFLFRQVFILGSDNSMIFPSDEITLSEGEEDFIARTKEIGMSRGIFVRDRSGGAEEDGETVLESSDYGWYTWYLGEGINFIFWKRLLLQDESEIITGIELNRMAVISGIIRDLPATNPDGKDEFRVVLKDVGNEEVYIWGSYEPAEETDPSAAVSVVPPLSSWRLEYFIPTGTGELGIGRTLPIFGVIAFVCLAIVGSAVYLYRESTREIRDAYKKVSFVNQVSHELKTPLTNIRMYAELLKDRYPEGNGKGGAYLDVVIGESERLSRLIRNVLTFAREQRKDGDFSPAEYVPDEIVTSVIERFRPSLEAKGIEVELDLSADKAVWIDRDIAEQIISNLVSNVEKYAAAGKYLGINTEILGDKTLFTVSDRGPGIPKNMRERVFTPFYRISNDSTEGISGTGIGLAIVRSLARHHSGSAAVEASEGGTRVKVVLRTAKGGEG